MPCSAMTLAEVWSEFQYPSSTKWTKRSFLTSRWVWAVAITLRVVGLSLSVRALIPNTAGGSEVLIFKGSFYSAQGSTIDHCRSLLAEAGVSVSCDRLWPPFHVSCRNNPAGRSPHSTFHNAVNDIGAAAFPSWTARPLLTNQQMHFMLYCYISLSLFHLSITSVLTSCPSKPSRYIKLINKIHLRDWIRRQTITHQQHG